VELRLEGRARLLPDDVNTDYIIPSRRKRDSLDPQILKQYLMEDLDPSFAATVQPGDLLVAGKNFGCGSAMEVAATVVLGAGIRAVLARSFARTYYRNAINNGLIPVTCDTAQIHEGDQLTLRIGETLVIVNETTGALLSGQPFPPIMLEILNEGGLVPYFQKYQDFRV
jgi:3-isopropylmalate/(R)-2-methylmalate dehydratase small subunit